MKFGPTVPDPTIKIGNREYSKEEFCEFIQNLSKPVIKPPAITINKVTEDRLITDFEPQARYDVIIVRRDKELPNIELSDLRLVELHSETGVGRMTEVSLSFD